MTTLYGIGDRSSFTQQNNRLVGTRTGSSYMGDTKRYYSSIDAEIYFGNYYIDEIVHIAFSIDQQTMPLFGFNSYVYDEMALGSRLISGSFAINFTSANYLTLMLEKLESESIAEPGQVVVEKEDDGTEIPIEVNMAIKTGSNAGTTKDYRGLKSHRKPRWHTGFDIDVMIGQDDDLGNKAAHCMLEGVYIVGTSLELDPSGQPVREMYQFIAKDIRTIN